jgi:hypothetical protein
MKKIYLLISFVCLCMTISINAQQYYCTPLSYCSNGDYISSVIFSNINRTSSCDNSGGYSFNNSTVGIVKQMKSYTLSVNAGYNDAVKAWIDFNQDGFFTEDEAILFGNSYGGALVNLVMIPASSLTGITRMRVKSTNYYYYFVDPCTSVWGETEDYVVNILPPDPCTGIPSTGLAESNVTYSCNPVSDLSLNLSGIENSGITFQWQSSPDKITWNDIAGAVGPNASLPGPFNSTIYFQCIATCTSSGLTSTSNIITLEIPSSTYRPSITVTGQLEQCELSTESVILTASASSSYLWNTGETTQSITVLESWPGIYSYNVYDPDSTTCFIDSDNYVIQVIHQLPIVYRNDTSTLCIGDVATLITYNYSGDSTNILWSNGATTATIQVSTAGTYKVSQYGCQSQDSIVIKTTNKNYRPVITLHGNDTICEGTTVVLTSNKNKNYLWNTGETTQSIFVTGSYLGNKYSVINPDSNSCVSASNSVTIYTKVTPYISPSGDLWICPGNITTLYAYVPWPYTPTTFHWSTGATTDNINVVNPATYSVSMDGCVSTQPAIIHYYCSAPYYIFASPLTVVKHKVTMRVTWYGECGIGAQLQYRLLGNAGWTTVNINSFNNYIDIKNLKNGYYEFRVRSKCQSNPVSYSPYSPTSVYYVPAARLEDDAVADNESIEELEGIFIYPNPTAGELNLQFHADAESAIMKIVNINGQVIEEKTISSEEGNFRLTEDISPIIPGIYFIMIRAGDQLMTTKFIKE